MKIQQDITIRVDSTGKVKCPKHVFGTPYGPLHDVISIASFNDARNILMNPNCKSDYLIQQMGHTHRVAHMIAEVKSRK